MTSLTSPLTLTHAVKELTNTEFSLDIPESTGTKLASIREWAMSKLERVLAAGSHDLPDCRCGAEMRLARSTVFDKSPDTEIRIYGCPACGHELRLMAWRERDIVYNLRSGIRRLQNEVGTE